MKERKTRVRRAEPINFPSDHGLIFVNKDEEIIALCKHKGCGNLVFKGSDKNQIEHRVLRERILDHMTFFEHPHEIDVIFLKSGRIVDAKDLDTPCYTSTYELTG